MDEHITSDTLPDEVDVAPSDGSEAGSQVSVKDVLSQVLGKEFPDDATALKSVKDTYAYVGKAGNYAKAIQQVAKATNVSEDQAIKIIMDEFSKPSTDTVAVPATPAIVPDSSQFVSRQEFDEATFYAKNPQYEEHKELISALQSKYSKPLDEVVKLDTFKNVFEKVSAYEQSEKSKSVLQTNPRLGQVTDKISQAREAVRTGNEAAARASAVDAVLDAYDMR